MPLEPSSGLGESVVAEDDSEDDALISVAEAARRLGVSRARIYALANDGALTGVVAGGALRITAGSVERRGAQQAPTGAPLSSAGAWAVLALASGEAAVLEHVAGNLTAPNRSRALQRLRQHGLLALVNRLGARASVRRFKATRGADIAAALGADPRVVLTGVPAARVPEWALPNPDATQGSVVDGYISELGLAELIDRYELEPDPDGAVVLRTVQEPWPFRPHWRVAPPVVVALDLAEAGGPALRGMGRQRLEELAAACVPSWRPRPVRKPPLPPLVSTTPHLPAPSRSARTSDELWDDRIAGDARQLVALLFVAGTALQRAETTHQLHIGMGRLARACAFVRTALPPLGLALVEHADTLELASAGDCAAVLERALAVAPPEPLSSAAHQVLAIVAYEQPVTRADIERIRGVESGGVIESLLARGLVAEERRSGVRGGPVPLMTTAAFLRQLGLGSLADLPPLVSADHKAHLQRWRGAAQDTGMSRSTAQYCSD